MADYVDLLIVDDDVVLDAAGEPQLIYDKACITQDIKHMVRDSGLLVEMIGERSSSKIQEKMLKLVLFIETDERLIPGTVAITRTDTETFFITATTYKYGSTSIEVTS
ncbi:hypothetical protein GCM10007891_05470 [Methylophaga thalassica]|uniref:DUF2590 family protein n=1 Tax=Methylophaga thalassica TaxID=40223 RepID=A0ABQ5TSJ5_9GAMM|nr:DUF2590 family protein [Methylophaga thalassica]GLP98693.1 hypothetical protein GCM10007891_05470 [Methylophaga thalassica]